MKDLRIFQFSANIIWGKRVMIDINKYSSISQVIEVCKNKMLEDLKTFIELYEKYYQDIINMNFHIHDSYIHEDNNITDINIIKNYPQKLIIYICDC